MTSMSDSFVKAWYQGGKWIYFLFPLMLVYGLVVALRRILYQAGIRQSYRSPLPVVIVGNITVGGTGKSPLVSYLVDTLIQKGYKPGVVSRGYGAKLSREEAIEVKADSLASDVGDEPLMLKRRLSCPVVVCPNRTLAVQQLERLGCDIVISDDGLQHFAMARDCEICVFDGQRGMGNGRLIPVGPLREGRKRIDSIDCLVINGADPCLSVKTLNTLSAYEQKTNIMRLQAHQLRSLSSDEVMTLERIQGQTVDAVAGIGNPERFFQTLEKLGCYVVPHAFPDHHGYKLQDFEFSRQDDKKRTMILMTEKDAVKCRDIPLKNAWYLPVQAEFDNDFTEQIIGLLKTKGYFANG